MATGVGGAASGDLATGIQSGQGAQNAVENNAVSDIAEALAAGKQPEQQAKKRTQELRLQGCAAVGLVGEACSVELRRQGYEIAQETAGILLPTTVYEVVPIGKGVGLAIKGTKKLVAIYKDSKTAKNAAEKAGAKVENNFYRDDDLVSKTKIREEGLKNAETVSTATNPRNIAKGQVTKPRNIQEQVAWNDVLKNPTKGKELRKLNKDIRFPQDAGFVKMSSTIRTNDGKIIEIHYQFNSVTNKVYDMKIVSAL